MGFGMFRTRILSRHLPTFSASSFLGVSFLSLTIVRGGGVNCELKLARPSALLYSTVLCMYISSLCFFTDLHRFAFVLSEECFGGNTVNEAVLARKYTAVLTGAGIENLVSRYRDLHCHSQWYQTASKVMDCFLSVNCLKGILSCQLFLLLVWLRVFHYVVAQETHLKPSHTSSMLEIATAPTTGFFGPIEISPAMIPHLPYPNESLPPMYPTFPTRYDPVLTGKCPVNFSSISDILDKTASDCSQPLAAIVGNVICCPQFSSLIHVFQGFYGISSDELVLQDGVADYCFSDIISILASRGANSSIPNLCSIKSSNFTGGSCPIKDASTFEKTVNTSKLLEACGTVDPLKECCRPVCQPAIMEAALKISGRQMMMNDNKNSAEEVNRIDYLNDCKGVVYSYLSRKLTSEAANTALRILSACKVNKVCPLNFTEPTEVIKACRNVAAPSPSCCSSLNTYIAGIQRQMLITNKQAIICATLFGSMLRKGGVITNVYELCDVDLKDFSIQGCLLRSFTTDVIFDNMSGFSFICDLSDNIAAPWPSSSSITSLSLCAPEMSLPALPTSETFKSAASPLLQLKRIALEQFHRNVLSNSLATLDSIMGIPATKYFPFLALYCAGYQIGRLEALVLIFSLFVFSTLLR